MVVLAMHGVAVWAFICSLLGHFTCLANPPDSEDYGYSDYADDESRLVKYLLSGYNKDVRPTLNHTDVLTVTFGPALAQIISVDERNQIMTTVRQDLIPVYSNATLETIRMFQNCWFNQVWMDDKLKWNPRDFGNLTTVMIPMENLWKPDILLYNNADSEYYHKIISTNGIVQYTGNVTWLATSIIRSTCAIDVRYFPFDQQNCYLKFASWTYDGYKVDLVVVTEAGDLSNYIPSGEWDLFNMTAKRTVVIYSCCEEPYPDITINIFIRRRPLFYVFNYLMPCGCASFFAFLGFQTPGESGEKITLGITTLLSITLFLLMVGEVMPPTASSLPLIATFYGSSMLFIGFTTAVQVWTLNLHFRGARGQKVPRWAKVFLFECVAPLFCIQLVSGEHQDHTTANASRPTEHQSGSQSRLLSLPASQIPDLGLTDGSRISVQEFESRQMVDNFANRTQSILDHVCYLIDQNEGRVKKTVAKDAETQEWQNLAYVLDKLLFVVFITITVSVFSAMFLNIPYDNIF